MRRRLGRSGTAILLFCIGIFFFALNDAVGKWLVHDYPVGQILFVRTLGAACFLIPILSRNRSKLVIPNQRGLHAVRVLVMTMDSFAFYFSTLTLPLADVMTFYLAAPLFITALSVLFLREHVGAARWATLAVGFLGVMIALRPSGAAFSPAALIALFGSLMFAVAIVVTRKLSETHWLTLVTWQFVGAGLVGAITSSFAWVTPTPIDVGLMLLVGIISMLCFISINRALRLAEASLLAPFHYTSIVWAVMLGWMVWGDIPSLPVIVGIAFIIGSGLFVWYRDTMSTQDAFEIAGGPT